MKEIEQRRTYDIQEILDYTECSLCHHLKYIQNRRPSNSFLADNPNIVYQEAVLETMRYYYINHQQGKPPELKALFDKYYTLWLEKTGTQDDGSILTRKLEHATKHEREKRSKYITIGYDTLRAFYEHNARTPQAILGVHHPYTIELKSMLVSGYFDVIREVEGKKKGERDIEVVSFQLSKKKPDVSAISKDLKLTAMFFGFEQLFEVKPDKFTLYYVNRNEEIPVFRSIEEYKRMLSILDGVQHAIEHVPPYPRPGAHRFDSPYKELCDNYYN